MIPRFHRMSVSDKLKYLIMVVCGVTLMGASFGYMVTDFLAHRRSAVDHLKVVARLIGTNVSAAVTFRDPLTAHKMLSSLKNEPDIHHAVLYDRSGAPLAEFHKSSAAPAPVPPQGPCCRSTRVDGGVAYRYQGRSLYFHSPIIHDAERIGCLHIRTGLDSLHARFHHNIRIMLTVLIVSLGVAYGLSTRFQTLISSPIISLSEIMGRISVENDYGLRAPTDRADEIGKLMSGFNHMISRIEEQNRRLARHQLNLEGQVRERTAALSVANKELQQAFVAATQARQEAEEASRAKSAALRELQETQSQLVQAAKLASIGELAAGVAHELNQPLMVIRGGIQLIRKSIRKNRITLEEVGDQMAPLEKNTTRMMHIIDHLRTFSRQSTKSFSNVDLVEIVEEALLLIGVQLRNRNIEIHRDFQPDLPKIQGNANQLEQVFLNLFMNARDAILTRSQNPAESPNRRGRINVTLRLSPGGGDRLEVLFEDDGCGIPEEIQEKVFDPFFTTKEVGKGTGLGLSISYGIIEDHGGRIAVDRSSGDGTAFRIVLPVNSGPPRRRQRGAQWGR